MAPLVEGAVEEARALVDAGFEALLVENFGDVPFVPGRVGSETVAAMAVIVKEVHSVVSCPIGVNVLRSDAPSALAVAVASGGSFIRVNVHTGTRVTDQGILSGEAHETLRARRALGGEAIEIWADMAVKHSVAISPRPLGEEALETAERGLADRLIVTGAVTGAAVAEDDLDTVRGAVAVPLVVGSGVVVETLPWVRKQGHGAIIGSALREGGRAGAPLDPRRLELFRAALEGDP